MAGFTWQRSAAHRKHRRLKLQAAQQYVSQLRSLGLRQIGVGDLRLRLMLWYEARRATLGVVLASVMLGLVVILTLVVQPMIVSLGRSIDFVPRNPAPPQMARFWMLHGAFTGLDGVKLLAGLTLLVRLIFTRMDR